MNASWKIDKANINAIKPLVFHKMPFSHGSMLEHEFTTSVVIKMQAKNNI